MGIRLYMQKYMVTREQKTYQGNTYILVQETYKEVEVMKIKKDWNTVQIPRNLDFFVLLLQSLPLEISFFSESPCRSDGIYYIGCMRSFAGLIYSEEYK